MSELDTRGRFEALLEAHRGILYKVAGSYRRGADREDLMQDICLQLWRAFPSYDPARPFATWMYRVALNVAISQLRRQDSGRHEPLEDKHLQTLAAGADAGEHHAELEALYCLIGTLPPLERALILLYLDDRSQTEMAEVLGISVSNVATKLGRIKDKLRGQAAAHDT